MQRNEHFSSRSDEKCECAGSTDSHFSSLRDEKCSFLCISRRSLRSLLEMRVERRLQVGVARPRRVFVGLAEPRLERGVGLERRRGALLLEALVLLGDARAQDLSLGNLSLIHI